MKTFDVSLKKKLPTREIEATNEEEAKEIYLEAVKRALRYKHDRSDRTGHSCLTYQVRRCPSVQEKQSYERPDN